MLEVVKAGASVFCVVRTLQYISMKNIIAHTNTHHKSSNLIPPNKVISRKKTISHECYVQLYLSKHV